MRKKNYLEDLHTSDRAVFKSNGQKLTQTHGSDSIF